jgi:hypothetical protein
MGTSPSFPKLADRTDPFGNEGGKARAPARAPPGGADVVIEHRADERPRYVPKALRTQPPGGDLVRQEGTEDARKSRR